MAGSYSDVPAHRMAYDRDGTLMFYFDSSTVQTLTSADVIAANDEDATTDFLFMAANAGDPTRYVGLIFPELRDVEGMYLGTPNASNGTRNNLQWSTDTTTGIDGTWTNSVAISTIATTDLTKEAMRESITTLAPPITAAKAIRFEVVGGIGGGSDRWFYSLHVYGSPSTGEATDRLRFWHPTLDQEIDGAHFDWGDLPRNAVVTKDFRIKNPSSQTAVGVTLTAEALTETTPTMVSEFSFSDDSGANYDYPLNIGDLAPATISDVLTVRRVVASTAATSLWWSRFVASASSWT